MAARAAEVFDEDNNVETGYLWGVKWLVYLEIFVRDLKNFVTHLIC